MKRFLRLYRVEQKLAFRSPDMLVFGVGMPVGILVLISMIAGGKMAGDGYTYLEGSFASLIAVGICAAAFMGIPFVAADYRDKKILKHFFVTPCSPAVLPLTQGIKLMKAVSMGIEPDSVGKIVVLLLGITVVCTGISIKTFRWE